MKDTAKKQDLGDKNKIDRLENYLNEIYDFRYNEVLKTMEYREIEGGGNFKEMEERERNEIICNLHRSSMRGFSSLLHPLLNSTSFAEIFNPFKTYFEGLPIWDNSKPDYIQQLCDHVTLRNQSKEPDKHLWFSKMFKKHLVRTVACSLRTIDFNKHCFVFQGVQNGGKSTFVRFLTPKILEPYRKDNIPMDNKDADLSLSKNFIINLDELSSLDKSEANRVKSLISMNDNKVREHFGRKDTVQVRYASFFGTTNDSEFLNDVTGNVRWLIFEIAEFNFNYLKNVDINLVWSQAYALSKDDKFKCQLTQDEVQEIESENRKFQKNTPEMDLVNKYFRPAEKDDKNALAYSTTEIMILIQEKVGNGYKVNNNQLGRALQYLGFIKGSLRAEYSKSPKKVWFLLESEFSINANFEKNSKKILLSYYTFIAFKHHSRRFFSKCSKQLLILFCFFYFLGFCGFLRKIQNSVKEKIWHFVLIFSFQRY